MKYFPLLMLLSISFLIFGCKKKTIDSSSTNLKDAFREYTVEYDANTDKTRVQVRLKKSRSGRTYINLSAGDTIYFENLPLVAKNLGAYELYLDGYVSNGNFEIKADGKKISDPSLNFKEIDHNTSQISRTDENFQYDFSGSEISRNETVSLTIQNETFTTTTRTKSFVPIPSDRLTNFTIGVYAAKISREVRRNFGLFSRGSVRCISIYTAQDVDIAVN